MGIFEDSLERAETGQFTRSIPKTAPAQMRFLVRAEKGSTRAAARALGVSQRTVERYLTGQFKRPRPDLAQRLEEEVRRRWQPRVRARARRHAVTSGGIVIETRARFGFTAAPGSTDDARLRLITQTLPPAYAARLFDARDTGAGEQQLRDIAAEGLGHAYFQESGRRAAGLQVEFTDVDFAEFEY